ncbi:HTH_Tnp_Tc3_2 domain-containing protein [Trichonephila clavipes]|nr:HTH_Tnp_Tc3_2 domain-containing protein [Trichonephila clavipes]
MSEFKGPYRVLEVRNNNLIIWKKGKRVTVNIDQVRDYRIRQSDTISLDSHVETLYEGQRSSDRSSRSQPGKFKGSRKTSSEHNNGHKPSKGNAGWEDPRLKRKVDSKESEDRKNIKKSKICRKRSLQGSEHRNQKRPTPEPKQGIKRAIPSSVSSRRIIGKLEEGCSVTNVAAEFGIAHSIVSRLWRQFQTTGTAIRGFSSSRPRGTTPADYRYIFLQARRNRRQTAGEIARHTTQATGRPISRFTVARRLHGGGLFARRPVRCVPLTPAHQRRRSLWCREHQNWRDIEWGRVLFTE